jgi:maltose-binding protein MalE
MNGGFVMLKKLIVFATALILLGSLATAGERKAEKSASSAAGHSASGTITAWNEATKEFTFKTSAGKEETFTWNEKTSVSGTPKVGEHVKVKFAKDKEGKVWVTGIHSGARPTSKSATASKSH